MADLPRSERNFMKLLEIMTQTLRACHFRLWPGEECGEGPAFDLIKGVIPANDSQETEDLLEIVRQALPDQLKRQDDSVVATAPIGVVIIALTYGYRALKAREVHHDTELSWSYFADCCYWTGVAVSGIGLADINEGVRKKLASRGGRAKNEPHAKMRDFAYQFVRDHCLAGGRWRSVTSAVLGIEQALSKFHPTDESDGSPPVGTVEQKTIYNWLAEMPDRDRFLPPKKTRRKL